MYDEWWYGGGKSLFTVLSWENNTRILFFLSYAFTSVHINVWYFNRLNCCWVEKCIWHFLIHTFILCNFPDHAAMASCFPVIMDHVCLRWSLDPMIPPPFPPSPRPIFVSSRCYRFVLSKSVKLFPVSSNLAPTCTKYKFHFPATPFQKLIFSFYSFCFPIYHKNILEHKKKHWRLKSTKNIQ